ncbi:MAG: methylenetetrahydrofolate reductase [NAD(P)H], partial [Salinisphaeraceae bacterium]|nr:methylenetetrahydrofolate reductase [NAD(P)H] [Salinisphaeraceae bacterium]
PPRSDKALESLRAARPKLAALGPAFFSVTFGAGGTTRDGTFETVTETMAETGIEAAPHISCIDSSADGIRTLLSKYKEAGIKRLVTLRGDVFEGQTAVGELKYANELVEFIRAETGDHFHLEVAAYPEHHPESASPAADLDAFERKVKAGADSAITQYFYNADAYFRFVDECAARGIDIPIVPGIMPITNYKQLTRFSDVCGAEIPAWIRKRLEAWGDDLDSIRAFGEEVVTRLCQQLIDAGVPGLHIYTLNQAAATTAIWNNLGLPAAQR